ncbi:MAG: transketolase [Deltaproteobacteria bacterium]|jgi:transketolase|nr:transketolase [Deltaproteobacteria bacterium]
MNPELKQLTLVSNTIAILAADMVEKANSGHPGMPMGMADIAAVLWLKHLNFNPKQPSWINRDRFVLSNGHGSALLYSMLHLSGYEMSIEDLKCFRQLGSKTPGHPEISTVGVEATTGPLGQGLANAVGLALGQKIMAERYDCRTSQNNAAGSIFNHKVFCVVGDGCLMEGITSEASSLAGHLKLNNLIVLYDDNHISIAGDTKLTFTEDVCQRYAAYGWSVQTCDGHNFAEIDQALSRAKEEKSCPTLIAFKTTIGKGSPNKANNAQVHGSPLGKDELEKTKKALCLPDDLSFYVPPQVHELFAKRQEELLKNYQAWEKLYTEWQDNNPDLAAGLKAQLELAEDGNLEKNLVEQAQKFNQAESSRKISEAMLQIIAEHLPALIGGSADLDPSTLTYLKNYPDIQAGQYNGKNIRYGVREHAMGAIVNGLSYYGGFLPYGSTFLAFADYLRPAIRVAALSDLASLFIFTHDSVLLGEDGPTHQPIEQLASLRIIPNLQVFRPADALETAICYSLAVQNHNSPSVMILSRQALPVISRSENFNPEEIKKGAYIVSQFKEGGHRCAATTSQLTEEIILVATGSEVALALEVAQKINNKNVRVVSMPCYEIYKQQSEIFKSELLPKTAKIVTLEAGVTLGWAEMVGGGAKDRILNIGINTFGASAPQAILARKFGFTADAVLAKINNWLQ